MLRHALFDCCLFLKTRLYDGRFHFQVKLRKRVKIKLKAFALCFMVRSYELFCHRTTWYTSCNMYTVLLFNVNKLKVNILDETDDISLGCIADVLSIHLQDLVIGKEFLVGRSVCKSSWRTQNQQRTRESLVNLVRSKGQVQLQTSMNISRVNFGLPSLQIFAQKTHSNDLQDSSTKKWLIPWSGWTMRNASLDGAACSHLCGNFQLWITCLLQLPRYPFRLRIVSSGWDGELQGYYSTQIPWSTLRHGNICKRKYSQSEYSKAGVYWTVLYPTFPSCAARMSH